MSTIQASQVLTASAALSNVQLTIDSDGTIGVVDTDVEGTLNDRSILAPAFLDIHTHGAVAEDVMSATPAGFAKLQRFYASRGVGWYCPTTVTAPIDATLRALEGMADAIERGPQPSEAQPIGIHLEGPFLSVVKRGMHPVEHLLTPSIAVFDRFYHAARGHVVLMTIAPELPGALDLIRHAVALGVRISVGHSNATAAETLAAIEAGASSATHTFNAMRPLDHREPGILGTTLDSPGLYAELIADTIHVAPPLIRLWHRAKGADRAILITDSMEAAGAGAGAFALGGVPVTVRSDRALLTSDLAQGKETLAGSILTMDAAVANLLRHTECPLYDAIRAASYNPAALLGRPELVALASGAQANLNRFDEQGRLIETYIRGERVEA